VIGLPLTAVAARHNIERVSHRLLSKQSQPRSDYFASDTSLDIRRRLDC
jgi:hypothetical protein